MIKIIMISFVSLFFALPGQTFAQSAAIPRDKATFSAAPKSKNEAEEPKPANETKFGNKKTGQKQTAHHAHRPRQHYPETYYEYDYDYWPNTSFCSARDLRFGGRFRQNKDIDCRTGEYLETGTDGFDQSGANKVPSSTPVEPETYFSPGPFEYFADPR